jgi:hypothetical protein
MEFDENVYNECLCKKDITRSVDYGITRQQLVSSPMLHAMKRVHLST